MSRGGGWIIPVTVLLLVGNLFTYWLWYEVGVRSGTAQREDCPCPDSNWQRYRACAEADDIANAPWWCVGSTQPVPEVDDD